MFRIDKSLVDNMNSNKAYVVITHKQSLPAENNKSIQDILKIKKDDTAILSKSYDEAKRILEAAQAEAEKILRTAQREGYEKGMADARAELARLEAIQSKEFQGAADKLASLKQQLYDQIQDQALGLSIDVAEKIINVQLERNDTLYVGIVEKAIEKYKYRGKIQLRVSRSEYNRFFKKSAERMKDDPDAPYEVVCDPNVNEGDCLLETEEGILNAGIGRQLQTIKQMMDERVNG